MEPNKDIISTEKELEIQNKFTEEKPITEQIISFKKLNRNDYLNFQELKIENPQFNFFINPTIILNQPPSESSHLLSSVEGHQVQNQTNLSIDRAGLLIPSLSNNALYETIGQLNPKFLNTYDTYTLAKDNYHDYILSQTPHIRILPNTDAILSASVNTAKYHLQDFTHYVISDSGIPLFAFGTRTDQENQLGCCPCCAENKGPQYNISTSNERNIHKVDIDKVTYDPKFRMELRKTHISNTLTNVTITQNYKTNECCNCCKCDCCNCKCVCCNCTGQNISIDPENKTTEITVHGRDSPIGYIEQNFYNSSGCCCCTKFDIPAWDIYNERGMETLRIVQIDNKKCCEDGCDRMNMCCCCCCCLCCSCCCEENPKYYLHHFVIENPKDKDGKAGYGSITMQLTEVKKKCCLCCIDGIYYSVAFDVIFPKKATVDEKLMIISAVARFAKGVKCLGDDFDMNYPLGRKDGWIFVELPVINL